ncbi:MAG: T9SS type A sorting domain-containing protein [Chitinophagales bacterium]
MTNHLTKAFAFASLLFGACFVHAQSLAPGVLASNGRQLVGANVQLSYTVGEPVTVTKSAGNVTLTQGYHQSYKSSVGISFLEEKIAVLLFPNPTPDQVQVKAEIPNGEGFTCRVLDLEGRELSSTKCHAQAATSISLADYAVGVYLIQLTRMNGRPFGIYRIEKL